jgi:hypothetical protein
MVEQLSPSQGPPWVAILHRTNLQCTAHCMQLQYPAFEGTTACQHARPYRVYSPCLVQSAACTYGAIYSTCKLQGCSLDSCWLREGCGVRATTDANRNQAHQSDWQNNAHCMQQSPSYVCAYNRHAGMPNRIECSLSTLYKRAQCTLIQSTTCKLHRCSQDSLWLGEGCGVRATTDANRNRSDLHSSVHCVQQSPSCPCAYDRQARMPNPIGCSLHTSYKPTQCIPIQPPANCNDVPRTATARCPTHKTRRGGSAPARCAMDVQAAATHTIHNWLHQLSPYNICLKPAAMRTGQCKSMHIASPAPGHMHWDATNPAKTHIHACKTPCGGRAPAR